MALAVFLMNTESFTDKVQFAAIAPPFLVTLLLMNVLLFMVKTIELLPSERIAPPFSIAELLMNELLSEIKLFEVNNAPPSP